MKPDTEKYRRHLKEFNLSADQENDIIHTMWRIMKHFADRAFGLDPVQLLPDHSNHKIVESKADLIDSKKRPLKSDFNASGIQAPTLQQD